MVELSRSTQKVGLFFATGLSGCFLGGMFAIAFAFFRERLSAKSDWSRSLSLAAALLAGTTLLPFLKYPANPPGIGEPSTIGSRTSSYFAMVVLSLVVVLAAWRAARFLRERGVSLPVRQVVVGLGFAAIVGLLLAVLPPAPDPGRAAVGLSPRLFGHAAYPLGGAGSILRGALRAGQPQGGGRLSRSDAELGVELEEQEKMRQVRV